MKHLVLASFLSALLGGMSGTGLVLWVAQPEPPPAPPPTTSTPPGADLARRLELVEQALEGIQPRVRVLPPGFAESDPASARTEPASMGDAPVRVASPVFEAAVLDIRDRAEGDRDSPRDEQRHARDRYWANDLTMRLGLTPAQTERLLAIQAELTSELEQERRGAREGAATPLSQRRAARQAIRQRAEAELRGVLAPRQQAAYDQLDDQLKLYLPRND